MVVMWDALLLFNLPWMVLCSTISISGDQLNALKSIFDATHGEMWNWDTSEQANPVWRFNDTEQTDPCASLGRNGNFFRWQGITCSDTAQRCSMTKDCDVTQIELNRYNMSGHLPADIQKLSELNTLVLGNNFITGTIPVEINHLTKLKDIALQSNLLVGTIPSELGQLVNLERLFLSKNMLDGSIPNVISSLTKLTTLYLDGNFLTGNIPSALGSLVNLLSFIIDDNLLDGPVPEEIWAITRVLFFYLGNNQLTGTLSPRIGNLQNLGVTYLDRNHFDGRVPSEIGRLTSLLTIFAENNQFTGQIPSEIGGLISLRDLHLEFNRLSGAIPSTIKNLTRLAALHLDRNALSDPLPEEISELSSLNFLFLDHNSISGTIPQSIGNLNEISYIYMENNRISGPIPDSMRHLSKLIELDLHENKLEGKLEKDLFAKMKGLVEIDLSSNSLSGPLPNSIFELPVLNTLAVYSNRFSGAIADIQLTNASSIETIDISKNFFTGNVPFQFFELPKLRNFVATGNCFTGKLPDSICSATRLQVLAFDGLSSRCQETKGLFRTMSGTIPACVFKMDALSVLHLAGNGFFGSLGDVSPTSFQFIDVSLSHNHLTGSIPASMLQSRFSKLDISDNRITHTLGAYDVNKSSPTEREINLAINRLSGYVPKEIEKSVSQLDILDGNTFDCNQDRSNLPSNDPNSEFAVCASDNLDRSLYIVCSALFAVTISLIILLYNKGKTFGYWYHHTVKIYIDSSSRAAPQFKYFILSITHCAWSLMYLSCLIFVVFLGLYCILSGERSYRTHTYQYRWFATATMLSGITPAILIVVFWFVAVTWFYWYMGTRRTLSALPPIKTSSDDRSTETTSRSRLKIALLCVMIIDFGFVLLVNGSYVYLLIFELDSSDVVYIQVMTSMVLLFWNKLMALCISSSYFHEVPISTQVQALTWMYLFNNILAPCLTVMCIDPSCFRDLIIPPNDLTASYVILQCDEYFVSRGETSCIRFVPMSYTVTYSPNFVYNYQCGSSTLRSFIPIILMSSSFSLLTSLAKIVVATTDIMDSIRSNFMWICLLVWRPRRPDDSSNKVETVALVASRLALLLTFGILCPYVAAAVGFTVFMIWVRVIAEMMSRSNLGDTSMSVDSMGPCDLDFAGFFLFELCAQMSIVSAFVIGVFLMDMAADDGMLSLGELFIFPSATILMVLFLYAMNKFNVPIYILQLLKSPLAVEDMKLSHAISDNSDNPMRPQSCKRVSGRRSSMIEMRDN